jgi:hypothetical protein
MIADEFLAQQGKTSQVSEVRLSSNVPRLDRFEPFTPRIPVGSQRLTKEQLETGLLVYEKRRSCANPRTETLSKYLRLHYLLGTERYPVRLTAKRRPRTGDSFFSRPRQAGADAFLLDPVNQNSRCGELVETRMLIRVDTRIDL